MNKPHLLGWSLPEVVSKSGLQAILLKKINLTVQI